VARTPDQNGPAAPGDADASAFLDPRSRHVQVLPLGDVDGVAVSVAAANLQAVLGLPADVRPPAGEPDYALIPARRQYDALPILKSIEAEVADRTLCLAVMNGDLCLPVFSYVLGEAQVNGRAAVISLFRLKQGRDGRPSPPARVYERLAKVALHEVAHVLGLTHCREENCLMRFSLGVEHIDELPMRFCPGCELELIRARRGPP
jgi:archaemetzincin